MGYYNLVYQRGAERFCKEAAAAASTVSSWSICRRKRPTN